MDIFAVLILLIHEHGRSFHHLISSSSSSFNVLKFLSFTFSLAWLELPPRYFIYFESIVEGFVFLILFLVHFSLVYRKATDLCVLNLYAATLLKVLSGYRSFLMEILESLTYTVRPSANKDTLTSSLLIYSPRSPSLASLLQLELH